MFVVFGGLNEEVFSFASLFLLQTSARQNITYFAVDYERKQCARKVRDTIDCGVFEMYRGQRIKR